MGEARSKITTVKKVRLKDNNGASKKDKQRTALSFERWGYQFEGAFSSPGSLKSTSGVYVIWCDGGDDWKVLDVGEAGDVKARVKGHDRADCWKHNCSGTIRYSATYTPDMTADQRRQIEQTIRDLTHPPCGQV
jgi:hypothetical protein